MNDRSLARFDTETPVLVFKPGRFPLHHGTLGIIRSLGSVGVPVYAVFEDRFVPAAFSRFLTGSFIWNPDETDDGAILAGLQAIGRQIGRRAVIIPTSDHASIFIEDHAATLGASFRLPVQRPGLCRSLADKRRLDDICRAAGVPCPASFFPEAEPELRSAAEWLGFPLLVKLAEPWRRPRPAGLSSTVIVWTLDDLLDIFRLAQGPPGLRLVVQEHIPSEHDRDAMFAGYCDAASRCLIGLTGEKLRSYPPLAGMTAASRSTDNPELRQLAERFLAQIEYHGIMDLEFRHDARDGRYKLLDFNPRVGAQFRLYENGAGIDVVRAMHLDLSGREVPQSRMLSKRCLIVENYELRVLSTYRRTRQLTWREWLRSIEGKREYGWFSRYDLLPGLMIWLRIASAKLQSHLRRRQALSRLSTPQFRSGRRAIRTAWTVQPS